MESPSSLTKKERRALRRQLRFEEQRSMKRGQTGRKLVRSLFIILPMVALLGFFIWWAMNQQPVAEEDIIAQGGLHWHPELTITINGVRQPIPINIGIGAVHKPIHTHDDTGVVHLEFEGRVIKSDTTLGKFFDAWGKQFNSNCILDYCNGSDGNVTMTVNGQNNTEYEQYLMQDKDKIEINYNRNNL